MSMSVNSASNALSYIQTLLQSMSSGVGAATGTDPLGDISKLLSASPADGSTGQTPTASSSFGPSPPPFSSGTMAALMALQGQGASGTSGSGGPQGLFSQLDTDGDGSVSQSEFETALSQSGVDTSSADALFSKLDQNGDGSVSQSELSSAAHRGHGHGHGHHHDMDAGGSGGSGASGGSQGLASLLNATGAQTQTASNADGSSTTTITYADGSTVTMTTPAGQQGDTSGGGTGGQTAGGASGNNLLEQLIKLQAQLVSQQGTSVSAVA